MESIWDSLLSIQGLMLLITVIVFVVTVGLVLRGLIGFVITSIMLFIAVITGSMIVHNNITEQIFRYESKSLPENKQITVSSIKQHIVDVYETFRTGVCTETVKVVYDPQAIDNLDEVISRLQKQQDQLQSVIKQLRTSFAKTPSTLETAEGEPSVQAL